MEMDHICSVSEINRFFLDPREVVLCHLRVEETVRW